MPENLNRYTNDFCKHRFSVVKRWQEGKQYFAICRCRWCDKWTRKVMRLDQDATSKSIKLLTQKFIDSGLENESSTDENPIHVQDVDTQSGEIKP